MKCYPRIIRDTRPAEAAFTLAEVLASLAFMAIVIPVAIQAMHVASLSGQVAERKAQATRIAERLLNESIVTTNWNFASPRGTIYEGARPFEWTLQNDNWGEDQIRLLTVQVNYSVQGRNYTVRLSTLAENPAFAQLQVQQ